MLTFGDTHLRSKRATPHAGLVYSPSRTADSAAESAVGLSVASDVVRHEGKELTGQRQDISLGEAPCAELTVDVFRQDLHGARILGGRKNFNDL